MKGWRAATICVLAAGGAAAQTLLQDGQKVDDARKIFNTLRGQEIPCDLRTSVPRFDFSLRLRTGYFWDLHLRPATLAGQKWIVLVKVTPNAPNVSPVYLSHVVQFSKDGEIAPEAKAGHFWVGPGQYRAQFLMFDDGGRVCRRNWQIDARLNSAEREISPLLAPEIVSDGPWTGRTRVAPPVMDRLSILMDVPDRVRTADQVVLVDALTALMKALPVRALRLVLFDLTAQKEVFRRDGFTAQSLPEVANAIRAVQFEPVNARALGDPVSSAKLVAKLAESEMHSGAVIFLGLPAILGGRPRANFGRPAGATAQFFYLQFRASRAPRVYGHGPVVDIGSNDVGPNVPEPVTGAAGADGSLPARGPTPMSRRANIGSDFIDSLVRQLAGKTLRIDTPDDFAKAVAKITMSVGASPWSVLLCKLRRDTTDGGWPASARGITFDTRNAGADWCHPTAIALTKFPGHSSGTPNTGTPNNRGIRTDLFHFTRSLTVVRQPDESKGGPLEPHSGATRHQRR